MNTSQPRGGRSSGGQSGGGPKRRWPFVCEIMQPVFSMSSMSWRSFGAPLTPSGSSLEARPSLREERSLIGAPFESRTILISYFDFFESEAASRSRFRVECWATDCWTS